MEDVTRIIQDIYDNSGKYVRLQVKSAKLEVYERVTDLIASGINAGFMVLFFVFALLFVNLGLAYWVSGLMHSYVWGFLIIGGLNFVTLGGYLYLRRKIFKNKLRDAILLKLSKDRDDFDLLLYDQSIIHRKVDEYEESIKKNFTDLKDNLTKGNPDEEEGDKNPSQVPRIVVTNAIDFLMKKVLFRNAGLIKKQVLPLAAKTLATSFLFKESKGKSLWNNFKLKLKRMF